MSRTVYALQPFGPDPGYPARPVRDSLALGAGAQGHDGARPGIEATVQQLVRQLAQELSAVCPLADPADPRGVANRDDVFLYTSRQIVIARAAAD